MKRPRSSPELQLLGVVDSGLFDDECSPFGDDPYTEYLEAVHSVDARQSSWDSRSDLDDFKDADNPLDGLHGHEHGLHHCYLPEDVMQDDEFSDDLLGQDDFEDAYDLEEELQDDILSRDSFMETLAPLHGEGPALPLLTVNGNTNLMTSFPSISNLFSLDQSSPADIPAFHRGLLSEPEILTSDNPLTAHLQPPALHKSPAWGLTRSITASLQASSAGPSTSRPISTLPVSTMVLNSALQAGAPAPAQPPTSSAAQPTKPVQCMEQGCQRRRLLASDGTLQYCRMHLLARGGTPARGMCERAGCERYARLSSEPNATRRFCVKHMQEAGLTPLAAGPTCQHPKCTKLALASSTGVKLYCLVHMGEYDLKPEGVVCNHKGCLRLATHSLNGECSYCVWHMREHGLQPMARFVECEEPGCRKQSTLSSSGLRRYCRAHLKQHGLQPMQDQPCTVAGCERQAVRGATGEATGLCRQHAREAGCQLQTAVKCAEAGCEKVAQYSVAGVRMYCDSHMRAHGQQPRPSRMCKHPGCTAAAKRGPDGTAYCKQHMQAAGLEPVPPAPVTRKRCRTEGCNRYAQPSTTGEALCSTHQAAARSESPAVPAARARAPDTAQPGAAQQGNTASGSGSSSRSPAPTPSRAAPVRRSVQGKHKCQEEGCQEPGLKVKDGSMYYCKVHMGQRNLRAAPVTACKRCQKDGCMKWAKRSTTGVSLYCKAHMKLEGLQPTSSIKRCAHPNCTHAAKPDTSGLWLYCKGHMQLYGMWPRDYKSQASSRKLPARAALLPPAGSPAALLLAGSKATSSRDADQADTAAPAALPQVPVAQGSAVSTQTAAPPAALMHPVSQQQQLVSGAGGSTACGLTSAAPSSMAGLDLGGPSWGLGLQLDSGLDRPLPLARSLPLGIAGLTPHATVGSAALLAPDFPSLMRSLPVHPPIVPRALPGLALPRSKVLLDLNLPEATAAITGLPH